MTSIHTALDQAFITDHVDLPRPETTSTSIPFAAAAAIALPRPLASVDDTGRISFGASCRIK